MPIEHFGSAKISPNGQAGIPVELRRALGINKKSQSVQVFADVEKREIHLVEGPDAENLYQLLRRIKRASTSTP